MQKIELVCATQVFQCVICMPHNAEIVSSIHDKAGLFNFFFLMFLFLILRLAQSVKTCVSEIQPLVDEF